MTRKEAGLTLIELLTSLTIAAITLMIGLPILGGSIERIRVATAMHLVSTDLAMARSVAIMGRHQVVVCPRTPELRCRDDRDWSDGWMIFIDNDRNRQPDADAQIIRITDPPSHRSLTIDSTRGFLRYQRDGRSAHSNQTVRVCSGERLSGTVVVNNLGRVRTSRPSKGAVCPSAPSA